MCFTSSAFFCWRCGSPCACSEPNNVYGGVRCTSSQSHCIVLSTCSFGWASTTRLPHSCWPFCWLACLSSKNDLQLARGSDKTNVYAYNHILLRNAGPHRMSAEPNLFASKAIMIWQAQRLISFKCHCQNMQKEGSRALIPSRHFVRSVRSIQRSHTMRRMHSLFGDINAYTPRHAI